MDFMEQNFFGPNIFLTKATSMTTTTTKMCFDTIEINLVVSISGLSPEDYCVLSSLSVLRLPKPLLL